MQSQQVTAAAPIELEERFDSNGVAPKALDSESFESHPGTGDQRVKDIQCSLDVGNNVSKRFNITDDWKQFQRRLEASIEIITTVCTKEGNIVLIEA